MQIIGYINFKLRIRGGFVGLCLLASSSFAMDSVEVELVAEGATNQVMSAGAATNLLVELSGHTNAFISGSGVVSSNTVHAELAYDLPRVGAVVNVPTNMASAIASAGLNGRFRINAPGTNLMVRYEVRYRWSTYHSPHVESHSGSAIDSAVSMFHDGQRVDLVDACIYENPYAGCDPSTIQQGFDDNGNPIYEGCGTYSHSQGGSDGNGNTVYESEQGRPCSSRSVSEGTRTVVDPYEGFRQERFTQIADYNQLFTAWLPVNPGSPIDFDLRAELLLWGFSDAQAALNGSVDAELMIHIGSSAEVLDASDVVFDTPMAGVIPLRFDAFVGPPLLNGNYRAWVDLAGNGQVVQDAMGRTNAAATASLTMPDVGDTNGFLFASATASGNTLMTALEAQVGDVLDPIDGGSYAEADVQYAVNSGFNALLVRYEIVLAEREVIENASSANGMLGAYSVRHNGADLVFTNACPEAAPGFVCDDPQGGNCGVILSEQSGVDANGKQVVEVLNQTPCSYYTASEVQHQGFDHNGNPMLRIDRSSVSTNAYRSAWIAVGAGQIVDLALTLEQDLFGLGIAGAYHFRESELALSVTIGSPMGEGIAAVIQYDIPLNGSIPLSFETHPSTQEAKIDRRLRILHEFEAESEDRLLIYDEYFLLLDRAETNTFWQTFAGNVYEPALEGAVFPQIYAHNEQEFETYPADLTFGIASELDSLVDRSAGSVTSDYRVGRDFVDVQSSVVVPMNDSPTAAEEFQLSDSLGWAFTLLESTEVRIALNLIDILAATALASDYIFHIQKGGVQLVEKTGFVTSASNIVEQLVLPPGDYLVGFHQGGTFELPVGYAGDTIERRASLTAGGPMISDLSNNGGSLWAFDFARLPMGERVMLETTDDLSSTNWFRVSEFDVTHIHESLEGYIGPREARYFRIRMVE